MKLEICSKCPIYNDGLLQLGIRKTHYGSPRFVCNSGQKKVLFVAEAYGQTEDEFNAPLIGRSGKLLDKLIEESGLNKFDLKFDNAVKCRPIKFEGGKYKNGTPTNDEIECCKPYMSNTLSFDPDLIILLGRTPFKSFFAEKEPAVYRGKGLIYNYNGKNIMTLAVFHPAACLYNPSNRPTLLKHLINATKFLESSEING